MFLFFNCKQTQIILTRNMNTGAMYTQYFVIVVSYVIISTEHIV